MEEKAIRKLSQLLKSVEMGVENYDKFLNDVNDPVLKEKFKAFKDDYTNYSQQISNRIRELGGEPRKGSGIMGIMQEISYSARKMAGHTPMSILKSAHLNETINLEASQKILYEGIEKESYDIIENNMNKSRLHMQELQNLIREYEIKTED